MNVRERTEEAEKLMLSPYAALSAQSRGRDRDEPQCDIRPVYQRDRDRILHCKSFRRLKHKTQVFLAPVGDHYRTRLTHTLEVSQIARTIARALRMNEDLTEAIALGHDLGHTPFGHAGEAALNEVCPFGFIHSEQSVRVVERLEKNGQGLNLTWEVRDGIRNHRTTGRAATLEGRIVRYADKIAYINHDIDDAIRAGILTEQMLPSEYTDILGHSVRERLDTMIVSIIDESMDKPDISMVPEFEAAMQGLRSFMFENVYTNPDSKSEDPKARKLLQELYFYYLDHPDEVGAECRTLLGQGEPVERVVCDYIAGMSDNYAITKFEELFVPREWQK